MALRTPYQVFCETPWRHSVKTRLYNTPSPILHSVKRSDVTRWKTRLYKNPPPYFIVLARLVKTKNVEVIEFHRIYDGRIIIYNNIIILCHNSRKHVSMTQVVLTKFSQLLHKRRNKIPVGGCTHDRPHSSFTDFPLIKQPKKPTSFLRRTPKVAPGHNTGYSYAHAHITQIKMQENIASMSLTILVRDFLPCM